VPRRRRRWVRLNRAWGWGWNCPGRLEPGRVVFRPVSLSVPASSFRLFKVARLKLPRFGSRLEMPSAGQTTCLWHLQWVDLVSGRPASSRLPLPTPLTHDLNDARHVQQYRMQQIEKGQNIPIVAPTIRCSHQSLSRHMSETNKSKQPHHSHMMPRPFLPPPPPNQAKISRTSSCPACGNNMTPIEPPPLSPGHSLRHPWYSFWRRPRIRQPCRDGIGTYYVTARTFINQVRRDRELGSHLILQYNVLISFLGRWNLGWRLLATLKAEENLPTEYGPSRQLIHGLWAGNRSMYHPAQAQRCPTFNS